MFFIKFNMKNKFNHMKQYQYKITLLSCILGLMFCFSSCREDLLNQVPAGELSSQLFWKTEADAEYALNGAYSATRRLFSREYQFDGLGEYLLFDGTAATWQTSGDRAIAYRNGAFNNPSGSYGGSFDYYFQYSYAAINHVNYVIKNVEAMLPNVTNDASRVKLEAIIGEARMLRGMIYFRLISMWGDVPYIDKIITSNDEVASIERTPIRTIRESILADFSYAWEKLPDKPAALGRFTKWGALAFRGKFHLYWACWNRTSWPWATPVGPEGGWPELDTFTPNAAESAQSYVDAATDLKKVIQESGITLFRNGEPGSWGEMGGCDPLPNYYYLFIPTANADPELMVGFTHGGTGTGQGEELMRDFGTRATEGSQGWGQPRYELADRYQSTITGDFLPPLIPLNPSVVADARTRENSALNPESYLNRDYRMKSTLLWDDETMVTMLNLKFDQIRKYRYKTLTGKVDGFGAINAARDRTGYIMRKFVRNYAGQGRSDGDYHMPVMRLADVYLLYAEAANEAYGPTGDGGLALEVVNKVRHRGNLPALKPEKYANKETFFYAIEQERIVELFDEGHRLFDIRRWRSIERAFLPPQTSPGYRMYDTHGALQHTYFNNTPLLSYQRMYIFRIPPSERNRNPNLTQNKPWL
jgi:hypothetical protein